MVKVIVLVLAVLMVWCMHKFEGTGKLRYMMGVFVLSVPMFILVTSEVLWQ